MRKTATWGLALLVALAFASLGCSGDDGGAAGTGGTGGSAGGTGGTGGSAGGTGGSSGMGLVTVVHLAPEVPMPGDTVVSVFVDGAELGETLSYGESTGRIPFAPGQYNIGVGLPGGDEPQLEFAGVTLDAGRDITVVIYARDGDPPFVTPFVFLQFTNGTGPIPNSPAGPLQPGFGRVFLGHGANDRALSPVDVVTTDEGGTVCTDLIAGFTRGSTGPVESLTVTGVDLPEGEVYVGLTLDDACPPSEVGPVAVSVAPDVVTIVVAVDEDTGDGQDVQLWAIVDASDTPIALVTE